MCLSILAGASILYEYSGIKGVPLFIPQQFSGESTAHEYGTEERFSGSGICRSRTTTGSACPYHDGSRAGHSVLQRCGLPARDKRQNCRHRHGQKRACGPQGGGNAGFHGFPRLFHPSGRSQPRRPGDAGLRRCRSGLFQFRQYGGAFGHHPVCGPARHSPDRGNAQRGQPARQKRRAHPFVAACAGSRPAGLRPHHVHHPANGSGIRGDRSAAN